MAAIYPSIPEPTTDPAGLRDSVLALKQLCEILAGTRGTGDNAIVSAATAALAATATTAEIAAAVAAIAAVRYDAAQTLTTPQKLQARTNIGVTSVGAAAAGHIPGDASGADAAAGEVGEYATATGSAAITSAAAAVNICNFTLAAGDWDLSARGFITGAGATSLSNALLSISSTSATHSTTTLDRYNQFRNAGGHTDPIMNLPVGPYKVTIATPTTFYLVFTATFTSTLNLSGLLRARRIR